MTWPSTPAFHPVGWCTFAKVYIFVRALLQGLTEIQFATAIVAAFAFILWRGFRSHTFSMASMPQAVLHALHPSQTFPALPRQVTPHQPRQRCSAGMQLRQTIVPGVSCARMHTAARSAGTAGMSARQLGGTRWQPAKAGLSRSVGVAATGTDGTTSTASSTSSSSGSTDERIKTTMADLDALLGIEEEPAATQAKVCLVKHLTAFSTFFLEHA